MEILRKVSKWGQISLLLSGSTLSMTAGAIASEPPELTDANLSEQIEVYDGQNHSLEQITNVSELKDVAPTEWAYEALRNLVERYGCIVGYPSSMFLGNRALTRWEFAAGLNACLNTMERLLQENVRVLKEDMEKLKRLAGEFQQELTALGTRVDNLESRVAFLEDHQFSTTTKLTGEVVFAVAAASDNQAVFQNRLRLYLETSFTGKDTLYTGLAAGASPRFKFNSNPGAIPEVETSVGVLTFQDYADNNIFLDYLSYNFPVGDRADLFVTAYAGATPDYLPTAGNTPIDDFGDGGSGSLSLFGAQNAIYYIGGGTGAGFNVKLSDIIQLSASYLAGPSNAASPDAGSGFFNGDYAALGQITLTPTDNLTFALTYVNSYHQTGTALFNYGFATIDSELFGVVGTSLANFPGGTDARVSANSFGIGVSYRIRPEFVISAWGGYTSANITNFNGDHGEIWTYALTLAFPDLFKTGNLGGVIVGVEPYLGNPQQLGFVGVSNNIPLHVEAFYRYQINDNISITPGLIYLSSSDQQGGDDAFLGVVRTTFTF
jgi:hypothetical protein